MYVRLSLLKIGCKWRTTFLKKLLPNMMLQESRSPSPLSWTSSSAHYKALIDLSSSSDWRRLNLGHSSLRDLEIPPLNTALQHHDGKVVVLDKPADSVKSQSGKRTLISSSSTPRKLAYSARTSELKWLVLYFVSNLSLTLFNKYILVSFPFPYTLTALHALCGSFGGYILKEGGIFEPRPLSFSERSVLVAFSFLYTLNIAVSNLSLGLVTVPVSTCHILSNASTLN